MSCVAESWLRGWLLLVWLGGYLLVVALLQAGLAVGSTAGLVALVLAVAVPVLAVVAARGEWLSGLLVGLVAYLFFAFYLSLWTQEVFGVSTRMALALAKNLLLLGLLAWGILSLGRLRWHSLVAWLFLGYVLISMMQGAQVPVVAQGYLLNSFLPLALVFLLLLGHLNSAAPPSPTLPLRLVGLWLLAALPLGFLVSHYLVPSDVIVAQQLAKGYGDIDGLPRNWWTWLGGERFLRMTGSAEDPIFYGYLLAFVGFLLLVRRRWVLALAVMLVLLSTWVKGALLLWVLAAVLWLWLARLRYHGAALVVPIMLVLLVPYLLASKLGDTSASVHLQGLLLPFSQIPHNSTVENLFGHGIGSSGNLYKAHLGGELSYSEWVGGGAESGFGLVLYQTGLVGLGGLLWLIVVCVSLMRDPAAQALWAVYWVNATLQENLINLNFLVLLLVAVLYLEGLNRARGRPLHRVANDV